jgi:hypothetical protein
MIENSTRRLIRRVIELESRWNKEVKVRLWVYIDIE